MNENKYMLPWELDLFFEFNGNLYTNPNQVHLDRVDTLSASIRIWDYMPVCFTLYVEFSLDDPKLSEKMNLVTNADLNRIDEAELWQHYQNGNGYVFADLTELLNIQLLFRVENGITVICTEQKDYNDSAAGIWNEVKAFRDYVRANVQNLYITAENRNVIYEY